MQKRIRFNALASPRGRSVSIKVKCTLRLLLPLLLMLRESFFNTSCIADIMKWPPFPSPPSSLHLARISLYAHLFFSSFALLFLCRLLLFHLAFAFYFPLYFYSSVIRSLRWRPSEAMDHCGRPSSRLCWPGYVLLHLSGVMKSQSPNPGSKQLKLKLKLKLHQQQQQEQLIENGICSRAFQAVSSQSLSLPLSFSVSLLLFFGCWHNFYICFVFI